MNLKYTGRILDWFVKDIRAVRARGGQPVVQQDGTRVVTPAGQVPTLWRFPQPLHWVEAVAAMRGFEGGVLELAELRAGDWYTYTEALARPLFVTGSTVRLVWHLLTPLNVTPESHLPGIEGALWRAATDRARPPLPTVKQKKPRGDFWTRGLIGDIEL